MAAQAKTPCPSSPVWYLSDFSHNLRVCFYVSETNLSSSILMWHTAFEENDAPFLSQMPTMVFPLGIGGYSPKTDFTETIAPIFGLYYPGWLELTLSGSHYIYKRAF